MIERRLRNELDHVAARFRSLSLWRGLALCWLSVAIAGAVFWFAVQ